MYQGGAEAVTKDSESDIVRKDMSYSPSSDRESGRLQQEQGTKPEAVNVLPGTGGPDDTGDIEMDPGEFHPKGDAKPEDAGH